MFITHQRLSRQAAAAGGAVTLPALTRYFLGLGLSGFGGPAALAARMQRDLVEERAWVSEGDYLDGLAFAQLAPGPLAAQLAMYLGYTLRGLAGCTAAAAGIVLPSFAIVLALAAAYRSYGGLQLVQALFYGIGPATIGIVAVSAARLALRTVKGDLLLAGMAAAAALLTTAMQREPMAVFVVAGIATAVLRGPRPRTLTPAAAVVPMALALPAATGRLLLLTYFAKASLFVFGSGLAVVPFLYGGVVQEHHWLTDAQFVDAIAVAMITPGPVVITVAFIGYLVSGAPGAAAAAIGMFGPVYLMVVVFAPVFRRHSHNPRVRAFVAGVTSAAAGGIAGAAAVLAGRTIHDAFGVCAALAAIALLARFRRLPEPLVIAAAAAAGLLFHA